MTNESAKRRSQPTALIRLALPKISEESKNEGVAHENRVNFLNSTHKGLESPTFSRSWSKSWKKAESSLQGIANVVKHMPKNIWFSENCGTSDLHNRYSIAKKLRDVIPHAICYTCSWTSNMGYAVYKYYPTLQALIEHSRINEDSLSKFSCFNLDLVSEDWVLVRVSLKPLTYHLMRRAAVEKVLSRKKGQKVADFKENMKGGELFCLNSLISKRLDCLQVSIETLFFYWFNPQILFLLFFLLDNKFNQF